MADIAISRWAFNIASLVEVVTLLGSNNRGGVGQRDDARHGRGSQAEAVDQDGATRRSARRASQSHDPARQRCVPRAVTPPPRPASLGLPTRCDPPETSSRLVRHTNADTGQPPPDARSALLPDGRDMHPEPQELHGGFHRQQRRGPAPPRARRMVGVAGEAGRRRAPSRGNEPHGRGRAPDGGAPAERSPRGVLRPVLRPARNRRPGALSGRAQRDRTAEPEARGGAARAGTRRRRVVVDQLVQ